MNRGPYRFPKAELETLDNGLRIAAVPMKDRRSVSIGIWVQAGGRDEKPELSGVSHFLEHIVFKGTRSRSADRIKESIEGVGGSMNAFTTEEYTCFLAKVAARHFKDVFDVLADMVLHASMRENDVRKERTVIMEEIKMTQDQPSQLVEEFFSEMLWPNHAIGRPLAGTLESVRGLGRRELIAYRDLYYRPQFITVAAAGAVEMSALVSACRTAFSARKQPLKKTVDLFRGSQNGPRLKLHAKKTEQTHLMFGMRALPKAHPDEYALDLLNIVLGGNMSSRLFNEVRERRGLAYEIGSSVRRYTETGAFLVGAGVDASKAPEALKVIASELRKVAKTAVGKDEMRRAKEFYLGQFELGLESGMNQMLWAGESVTSLGHLRTPDEVMAGVTRVDAEDLRRVARTFFDPAHFNLAVVGPGMDERMHQRFSRALTA